MANNSFVMVFGSILDSTVWRESKETRLVWITMLAMKDYEGRVYASIPGLADRAKVCLDECVEALKRLKAPDKYSRTPNHEGRRIEDAEGGWRVLNHGAYVELGRREARRVYERNYKRRRRAEKLSGKPLDGEPAYEAAVANGDGRTIEHIERREGNRAQRKPDNSQR